MRIIIKDAFLPPIQDTACKVLEHLQISFEVTAQGEFELTDNLSVIQFGALRESIRQHGLELIRGKKSIVVERIKRLIHRLVCSGEDRFNLTISQYLSRHLHYNYTYLASLYSCSTGSTIEQDLISLKINKAKELILQDAMTLTEIAEKLHYSSTAHLSSQFKKVTGYSPSEYRKFSSSHPIPASL